MSGKTAPKWLKPLVDFGPLVLFFVAFKMSGLMAATGALIIATVVLLGLNYALTRHIALMPLITAAIVIVFGGLTLWLDDERFVKLKPTIVQALFALILFGGILLKKPTLQYVMGEAIRLSNEGWRQLTWRFALFFAAMAVLNEIVWRSVSTDLWVDFKVFGIVGLTMIFSLAQLPLMKRHMIDGNDSGKN
ncbi:intracellular septation protein [Dongia mobilis]|uniref:Inner membrane-spanning protein YciB n=1 Tax=Dongia mobilis TaxID=578943 RepID=A0A4R6WKB8_9PROT|nr:septation protein A [Dongia mobilis]TDQ80847.1 intracellular septation protein [Dongia mobilis]